MIKFYQKKYEQEENGTETDSEKKDKINQLEIKLMKSNEKIKELEENIIINQKALEYINDKDDEIEELKKKIGGTTGETIKKMEKN